LVKRLQYAAHCAHKADAVRVEVDEAVQEGIRVCRRRFELGQHLGEEVLFNEGEDYLRFGPYRFIEVRPFRA
jgi:hypothetical protein